MSAKVFKISGTIQNVPLRWSVVFEDIGYFYGGIVCVGKTFTLSSGTLAATAYEVSGGCFKSFTEPWSGSASITPGCVAPYQLTVVVAVGASGGNPSGVALVLAQIDATSGCSNAIDLFRATTCLSSSIENVIENSITSSGCSSFSGISNHGFGGRARVTAVC